MPDNAPRHPKPTARHEAAAGDTPHAGHAANAPHRPNATTTSSKAYATKLQRRRARRIGLVALALLLVAVVSAVLWGAPYLQDASGAPKESPTYGMPEDGPHGGVLREWQDAADDTARGAAPLGSRAPTPPSDATWVSPGASNGDGSKGSPFGSVTEAVEATGDDATIVLREGVYEESVFIIDEPGSSHANVTIQAAPGEEVWFDGSAPLKWRQVGGRVVARTQDFSTWNDYASYGEYDETDDLAFIGEQNPVAADPTEVWVDGKRLWQVAANPGRGEFAVERGIRRDAKEERDVLVVLGEKPAPHADVRISARNQAIVGKSPGLTLEGFGVRGYGTPVNWMGTVYLQADSPTVRDLILEDLPTNALSLSKSANALVENVSVYGAGLQAIGAMHSDGAILRNNLIVGSNHSLFNAAPVAAGIKIVQTRDFTVTTSTIADTREATALWVDESATGFTLSDNLLTNSGRNGMQVEISGDAKVTGNTVLGSAESGIKLYDAENVDVSGNLVAWSGGDGTVKHSTITANIMVAQDKRRASNGGMGVDTRGGTNGLTWVNNDLRITDNVLALPGAGATAQIAALDLSGEIPASEFGITISDCVLVASPPEGDAPANAQVSMPIVFWRDGADHKLSTLQNAAARLGNAWGGNEALLWDAEKLDEGVLEDPSEMTATIRSVTEASGVTIPPALASK